MDVPVVATVSMVLRKRSRTQNERLVLHLSSPPPNLEPSSDSEFEPEDISANPSASTSSKRKEVVFDSGRQFKCGFEGCSKSYTKPSRLAEHERTHTGERPYACTTCDKTYLRESHLQAHTRTHLPESSKPFVCDHTGCGKRFWTAQHLRVHSELHQGEKPFKCTEVACDAAFSKHHQLRQHVCTVHSPPGTKPYRCEHSGCTKSFTTNQKLRTHLKIHDDKRYTCAHQNCLTSQGNLPTYYPTWSALQQHMRNNHPPKCPHPSCTGKVFSAQRNLRAHLKLHEQRDREAELSEDEEEELESGSERARKRRRGGEVGRDWICDFEGCDKEFKSKKALNNHININHLGQRNFVCPHEDCARAFGYKHLLQRHLAKIHVPQSDEDEPDDPDDPTGEDECNQEISTISHIDDITGVTYAIRTQEKLKNTKSLVCPYPNLHMFKDASDHDPAHPGPSKPCDYVFSRAYDLRRHLRTVHDFEADKDRVDEWVRKEKRNRASSS